MPIRVSSSRQPDNHSSTIYLTIVRLSDFKPALSLFGRPNRYLQAWMMDSGFCNLHTVSDDYSIDEKFLITEALF